MFSITSLPSLKIFTSLSIFPFVTIIRNSLKSLLTRFKIPSSLIKNKIIEANFIIDDIPVKCQLEYFCYHPDYTLVFEGIKPAIFYRNSSNYITGLPSYARSKITVKSVNNSIEKIEIIDKGTFPKWENIILNLTT